MNKHFGTGFENNKCYKLERDSNKYKGIGIDSAENAPRQMVYIYIFNTV